MRILKSTAREYALHMRILRRTFPIGLAEAGGIPPVDARKESAKKIRNLLPKGQKTSGHYFYAIHNGNNKIGYLWLMKQSNNQLFICDIYIFTRFRSKGFGSKTMAWIERTSRKFKCDQVRLHVFGHNRRGINFYKRCGFQSTNIIMRKKITEPKKNR